MTGRKEYNAWTLLVRTGLLFFSVLCMSLVFTVHGSAKKKVQASNKGKVSYVSFEGQAINGKGRVSFYSYTSSKDTSQVDTISSWKPDWVRKIKKSRADLR